MAFRSGDRVRRVALPGFMSSYKGMVIGDVDTVVSCNVGNLVLEKFGYGHSPASFELHTGKSAPRKGFGAFLQKYSL